MPRAYDAIVLLGPPGCGKSFLGAALHTRRLAHFEELEAELLARFGTGAEFAARKSEALAYVEARLRDQLSGGNGQPAGTSSGQTAGAVPVLIQSTGHSDREILLRLAAEYRLLFARINTPREVCIARVRSRPQHLNLNNDPDYSARFHDHWQREVAPGWSFDLELSGVDAEADIHSLRDRLLPTLIQAIMSDYRGRWWVCGGWAVDLHLGRLTREHSDIEIAIPRTEQFAIREYLQNWLIRVVRVSEQDEPNPLSGWDTNEFMELPIHELHATNNPDADKVVRDFRELSKVGWGFEIMLNETDAQNWHYRRDARVTLPLSRFGLRSADGLPYVCPEAVLLYKAKASRDRDEQDFSALLPMLSPSQRDWLTSALETAHPDCGWRERLMAL